MDCIAAFLKKSYKPTNIEMVETKNITKRRRRKRRGRARRRAQKKAIRKVARARTTARRKKKKDDDDEVVAPFDIDFPILGDRKRKKKELKKKKKKKIKVKLKKKIKVRAKDPDFPFIEDLVYDKKIKRKGDRLVLRFDNYDQHVSTIKEDITKFLKKFGSDKISIAVILKSTTGKRHDILSRISKKDKLASVIKNIILRIQGTIDFYEEFLEFPIDKLRGIVLNVKKIKQSPPPAVALSLNGTNCLLAAICEQTNRRSVLKEDVKELCEGNDERFIKCWDFLENKYKCNITIFDQEGDIWRKSDMKRTSKSKKYNDKVLVKLHNYHVEGISGDERHKAFSTIKHAELSHETINNVWSAIRKENKNQDRSFTRVVFLDKEDEFMHSEKQFVNRWISEDDLEKMYAKFLTESKKKFEIIETSTGKIIGIIDKDICYKSKDLFKNLSSDIIPYNTTKSWSLSSFIRNEFKKYLSLLYPNNIIRTNYPLQQISNDKIYKLCSKTQSPFFHVFNSHIKIDDDSEDMIYQIDMKSSYYNTSLGNFPAELQKYFKEFPCAPRCIQKIDQNLDDKLLESINKVHGFALIKYDQRSLSIKTWFDNEYRDRGVTYVSIPILQYMHDLGVKVFIYDIHYSDYSCDPFKPFFKDRFMPVIDELEKMNDSNNALFDSNNKEERAEDYNTYRKMPNLLYGGLNRKTARIQIFSTISKEEFDRFLMKCDEFNRLIVKITYRKLNEEESEQVPYSSEPDRDELIAYIIHYQNSDDVKSSFNMPHWSKYVIDYQKMIIHSMACKMVNNDISKLACVNCDSVTYNGESFNHELFQEEVTGKEIIAINPGLRCINGDDGLYQKHSCYENELTYDKFVELLELKNNGEGVEYVSNRFVIERNYMREHRIEPYNISTENKPLKDQVRCLVTGAAGHGKSEFILWLQKDENTKMSHEYLANRYPEHQDVFKQYNQGEHLVSAPTHSTRKTSNAVMTIKKFYYLLKLGNIAILKDLKILVFEESSMVLGTYFYSVDALLRYYLKNRPFGGLSINVIADFKQLGPYNGKKIWTKDLIFNCELFKDFKEFKMTENFRQQKDCMFQRILTKIRGSYEFGGDIDSLLPCKYVLPSILNWYDINAIHNTDCELTGMTNELSVSVSNKARIKELMKDYNTGNKLQVGHRYLFRAKYERKLTKEQKEIVRNNQFLCSEFIIKDNKINICNSDKAVIHKINDKTVTLQLLCGDYSQSGLMFDFEKICFREPNPIDYQNYNSLTNKYAKICFESVSTIYSAQGRTVEKCYVDNGEHMNIMNFYVAMSRAKEIKNILIKNLIDLKPNEDFNICQETYDNVKLELMINNYDDLIKQIPEERRPLPSNAPIKDSKGNKTFHTYNKLKSYFYKASRDKGNLSTVNCIYENNIRLFSKNYTLQNMQREFRDTLLNDIYMDIDIVNSGPTIVNILCKRNNIECPYLEHYINKREEVFKYISKDRAEAKRIMIVLLNGGFDNVCERNEWVGAFYKEMKHIIRTIAKLDKKYYDQLIKKSEDNENTRGAKELCKSEGWDWEEESKDFDSTRKVQRTIFSNGVYGMETAIIRKLLEAFKRCDVIKDNNAVLTFDGILVRKQDIMENEMAQRLKKVEKSLFEAMMKPYNLTKWEQRIQFKIKPMNDILDLSKYTLTDKSKIINKKLELKIKYKDNKLDLYDDVNEYEPIVDDPDKEKKEEKVEKEIIMTPEIKEQLYGNHILTIVKKEEEEEDEDSESDIESDEEEASIGGKVMSNMMDHVDAESDNEEEPKKQYAKGSLVYFAKPHSDNEEEEPNKPRKKKSKQPKLSNMMDHVDAESDNEEEEPKKPRKVWKKWKKYKRKTPAEKQFTAKELNEMVSGYNAKKCKVKGKGKGKIKINLLKVKVKAKSKA